MLGDERFYSILTALPLLQNACEEREWALCLDDDIYLHPTALADLVMAAKAQPKPYMATGRTCISNSIDIVLITIPLIQHAHILFKLSLSYDCLYASYVLLQGIHLTYQRRMQACSHIAAWSTIFP